MDAELMAKARAEELEFTREVELFDEVPVNECWGVRVDLRRVRSGWM